MPLPKATESISISFPSWLIEEVDLYCEKNDYTRSKFVSRAVRKYLWLKNESIDNWTEKYTNDRSENRHVNK